MPVLTHWPSGTRDTTEYPEISVTISPKLRDHLKTFLQLNGKDWTQTSVNQRTRTLRKMYEKMGLIYKEADHLRLSRLGEGLKALESNIRGFQEQSLDDLRATAMDIQSRYQLRNPTERQEDLPQDCDVFPYRCIWQAMTLLDGKIHHEEMNRVILYVMRMSELDAAVSKISAARKMYPHYRTCNELELRTALGAPVFDDQPSARIAPWYSLAGWGGLIIEQKQDSEGFRHFNPQSLPLVEQVLKHPPVFYEAADEDDWFAHYLGDAILQDQNDEDEAPPDAEDLAELLDRFVADLPSSGLGYPKSFIARFLAGALSKQFVIFTGLSGSGKTKLAQALARWITPAWDGERRYEIISVGADWTSRDNILGYPDALDEGRYVKSKTLELILRAHSNQAYPYFLILDEMNLSHVERYFADILSALESAEPLHLHTDSGDRDGVPAILPQLPPNLLIIGTINVDDTTYQFSPKVLDRANVIEFTVRPEEMAAFLYNPRRIDLSQLDGKGVAFGALFVSEAVGDTALPPEIQPMYAREVLLLFQILSAHHAEFGFRVSHEIGRFLCFHQRVKPVNWHFQDAMDAQIVQKILPKLHGSRKTLEPLLTALAQLCYGEHVLTHASQADAEAHYAQLLQRCEAAAKLDDYEQHPLATDRTGDPVFPVRGAFYKLSYEKILRMLRQLEQGGFVSFSEA